MILYDETGIPVGIGATDEETVERAKAAAWHEGFRAGREEGIAMAKGDWIVAAVILAFAIVISGWIR